MTMSALGQLFKGFIQLSIVTYILYRHQPHTYRAIGGQNEHKKSVATSMTSFYIATRCINAFKF